MTLIAPSTFAPSLPSLPSYPRPLAASRSASPAPASKRRPLNRTFQPSYPGTAAAQFTFSTTPFGDTANDSDDPLSSSFYSDRDYRSSLVTSGSRKRGFTEDDVDDFGYPARKPDGGEREREGGGKRRIIDVVGGTLGGVLRGAWEMFRPRFFSSASTTPPSPPPAPIPAPAAPAPTIEAFTAEDEMRAFSPGRSAFGGGRARAASAATLGRDRDEEGMATRWVMVPPSSAGASTASPRTKKHSRTSSSMSAPTPSRRQRPIVATRKRGLRAGVPKSPASPGLYSPAVPSGQFTFGSGRKGKSNRNEDLMGDEDMDEDMRRFNDRLKMMIREGKEALGAKVEVVYDDEDDDMF